MPGVHLLSGDPATNVSFSSTGLAVVTGANVDAALRSLDTWANARPTSESGLLSALPANGARPNGSTYLATDQFGGTTYRMVAGAWVQQSPGISQASGQYAAGPVQLSTVVSYGAVGVTETDMTGMSLAVPASPTRPIMLRFTVQLVAVSGTAASGSTVLAWTFITDSANTHKGWSVETFANSNATGQTLARVTTAECYLPAPVAAGTYKIRYRLNGALPANWSNVNADPTGLGLFPGAVNSFVAEYK